MMKQYTFNVHITGRVNAVDASDAVARIRAGMYQDRGKWIEIEQVDVPQVVEDGVEAEVRGWPTKPMNPTT